MTDRAVTALAERVASRLGRIEGVVAVALGGSWARGDALPRSDLDLGIYYAPAHPPSLQALRDLAQELDDRHPVAAVTGFGEWGSWINGGGWLEIDGHAVDWLYRDLTLVTRVIKECRAGRTVCHYQPGHPHGFHTHIYLGEVQLGHPLHDPDGVLTSLKQSVPAYPPRLRQTLMTTYLWQADFALSVAQKGAAHGDVVYVAGCLFQCVASLVQVLFALNECYFLNEKGAVAAVESFDHAPPGFSDSAAAALAHPGDSTDQLLASIELLQRQVAAVRLLCATPTVEK